MSSRATISEQTGSLAGKSSGLKKEKAEKEQDFPLMAGASHWKCLGAHSCSFRSTRVSPGMRKLCGSRQLCSLVPSLNSFLFYLIIAWS